MGRHAPTARYIRIHVKNIDEESSSHFSRRSISQRVSRCIRGFEAQLRVVTFFADNGTTNTALRPDWTTATTVAAGNDDFLSHWPSWSSIGSQTQERRAGRHDGHEPTRSNSRCPSQTQTWSSNQSGGTGESSRIKCCRCSRHVGQERIRNHTSRCDSCSFGWTFDCTFASSCTCFRSSNHRIT